MVGLGTFLFLLSLWFFASWVFKRRMPKSKLFLWIAAAAGVLSVVTLEAGWVVTEVGRQPWIVRNYMKVEDAATANTGVWITFVAVLLVYARSRGHADPGAAPDEPPLARRRRGGEVDEDGRTARDRTARSAAGRRRQGARSRERRGRADPHGGGHRVRVVRRRRLRCRVLGPHRRRRRARSHAAVGDHPLDRAGVGGEPRLADLLPRRALDRLLGGVRLDHAHALRAVVDRGAGHRVPRLRVRVPQGGHAHVESAQLRCRVRVVVGDRAVLHGRGRRCHRVRSCPRGRQGRRPVVELDQPHLDPRRRARGHRVRVPRGRLHGVGRQAPRPTPAWSSTSGAARWSRRS